MTDKTEKDAEQRRIEREARSRRPDFATIIAGHDGGGHLKGASPTPVLRRALLEIEQWLATELPDHEGALRPVILRRLALQSEQLEAGLGHPAVTVGTWLDTILPRPEAMAELVRQADMEWGQLYHERPHFERADEPTHADDPYTVAGVTALLAELRRRC